MDNYEASKASCVWRSVAGKAPPSTELRSMTADLATCRQACLDNRACEAFGHNGATAACRHFDFRARMQAMTVAPGVTTYAKDCFCRYDTRTAMPSSFPALATIPVASTQVCEDRCFFHPDCTVYFLASSTSTCTLHTSGFDTASIPLGTVKEYVCVTDVCFTRVHNTDAHIVEDFADISSGGLLDGVGSLASTTAADCLQQCRYNRRCQMFVMNQGEDTCYLQAHQVGTRNQESYDSLLRIACPAGGGYHWCNSQATHAIIGDHCLAPTAVAGTWEETATSCSSQGGFLAVFLTDAVLQRSSMGRLPFLYPLSGPSATFYWVGLRREGGAWSWRMPDGLRVPVDEGLNLGTMYTGGGPAETYAKVTVKHASRNQDDSIQDDAGDGPMHGLCMFAAYECAYAASPDTGISTAAHSTTTEDSRRACQRRCDEDDGCEVANYQIVTGECGLSGAEAAAQTANSEWQKATFHRVCRPHRTTSKPTTTVATTPPAVPDPKRYRVDNYAALRESCEWRVRYNWRPAAGLIVGPMNGSLAECTQLCLAESYCEAFVSFAGLSCYLFDFRARYQSESRLCFA